MAKAAPVMHRDSLPSPSDSLTARYAKAGIVCNSDADLATLLFFEVAQSLGLSQKELAADMRWPETRLAEAKRGDAQIPLGRLFLTPLPFQAEFCRRWGQAKGFTDTPDELQFADLVAALVGAVLKHRIARRIA